MNWKQILKTILIAAMFPFYTDYRWLEDEDKENYKTMERRDNQNS